MAKKEVKKARGEGRTGWRFLRYCLVIALFGAVLLAWPSMLTFSATDPPSPYVCPPKRPVDNAVGLVGAYLAYKMRYWLGAGSYMALLFATIAAFITLFGGKLRDVGWRVIGVALLVVATSSAAYVLNPTANVDDPAAGSVGVVGLAAGRFVLERFSRVGSYIIISLTLCVGIALAADRLVMTLPALGRRIWARRGTVVSLVGGGGQLVARVVSAGARGAASLASPRATPAVAGASPAGRGTVPGKGVPAGRPAAPAGARKGDARWEPASPQKGAQGKAADGKPQSAEPQAPATHAASVDDGATEDSAKSRMRDAGLVGTMGPIVTPAPQDLPAPASTAAPQGPPAPPLPRVEPAAKAAMQGQARPPALPKADPSAAARADVSAASGAQSPAANRAESPAKSASAALAALAPAKPAAPATPQGQYAPAVAPGAALPAVKKPAPASAGEASKPPIQYELPSTDLLADPTGNAALAQEEQARRNQEVLQQTFRDFGVEAEVVGYQTGPVITLFEIALAPGVKVAQISNLATDIARALAVPGVRVVPPRFGKDTIGVEIPNLDKEMVRIKELMALAPQSEKEMHLPLYLGKDAGGNAIVADLAAMPHLLIAGTTGSGKSVCINSIIMSILMTRSPEDVRLILVDPKMVEMAAFDNIPHLPCPIVHDMSKAEEILEWAATKMDERYELLKEANVKNIAGFNRLSRDEIYKRLGVESPEEKVQVQTRLPYYVIIIDELADLIMTADREVETHIIRIAQKARAVGIHLILATQRPSVNVVTGLIKSNMPCRISFRVASRQESRIVLDQNGAEVLLGRGDMLFLQPGVSTLTRGQGTLIDDTEIKTIVGRLREKCSGPQYDAELMRLDSKPSGDGAGERDELFDQAVEIVLASQRGSVSLVQRRLQVGYSRASRIIDQMADAGILGDYKGSQARECLMTVEDWRQFQKDIAADKSGANSANGEGTSV